MVNEPGLYTLILRSRKKEAVPFRRWVTHEVLPTIRKTGTYFTGIEARTLAHLMGTDLKVINGVPMMSHIQIGDLLCEPGKDPRYDNVKRTMDTLQSKGVISFT